jgi:hypothetical protein
MPGRTSTLEFSWFSNGGGAAMAERHGLKQLTFVDRLSAWADQVRKQAEAMAPGPEQNALLKKIAQADETTELYNWIYSPELQSPK